MHILKLLYIGGWIWPNTLFFVQYCTDVYVFYYKCASCWGRLVIDLLWAGEVYKAFLVLFGFSFDKEWHIGEVQQKGLHHKTLPQTHSPQYTVKPLSRSYNKRERVEKLVKQCNKKQQQKATDMWLTVGMSNSSGVEFGLLYSKGASDTMTLGWEHEEVKDWDENMRR